MARAFPIQTNFTSGEVSKHVSARVDVAKYFNGAETLENFIVKAQGGAFRRSGTRYINTVKDSNKLTLVRRFEFSTEQAYILEFGEFYIRIYRDRGVVLDGTGVEIEIPTPYRAEELRELKFTQSADVLYIVHPKHAPRKVTRTSHTSWTIKQIDFLDGPYLDEDTSGAVMTIDSVVSRATIRSTNNDFVSGDVGKFVEFINEGDTLIGEIITFISPVEVIIEPKFNVIDPNSLDPNAKLDFMDSVTDNTPPIDRVRSQVAVFNDESENSYIKVDGVWYLLADHKQGSENVPSGGGFNAYSADIMEVASTPTMVTTPTGVITFSDHLITARVQSSVSIFDSARDVDRRIRFKFGVEQVWAKVSVIVDPMTANVELGRIVPNDPNDATSLINGGKTSQWRFGAWYVDNYPSIITFHEERLVFANTSLQPQTLWFSVSADYENMAPTESDSIVADDSGMNYTMVAKKVNAIKWLETGAVLLIGTRGAEWQAKASNIRESLTPTNINVLPQTPHGSTNYIDPEKIGSAILFIERNGHVLRELTYSFELDSYTGKDMSLLSEHVIKHNGNAIELTYQAEPNSVIWFVTDKGLLIGFTYEKDQEVAAWFRCPIGGDGFVESIASIPSVDGVRDDLYLTVKRIVNGQVVRYIEVLEKPFDLEDPDINQDDMFFVDSGLTYDGVATSVVTGLDHLEGKTVQVCANGGIRPEATVASGSVTIEGGDATKIHVGLGFDSKMKILPLEAGAPEGTSQGKLKRVDELVIRVFESLGFKHGPDEDNLDHESFRVTDDPMDAPPDVYSGDRKVELDTDYTTTGQYVITQDQPHPLTILALMAQLNVNE